MLELSLLSLKFYFKLIQLCLVKLRLLILQIFLHHYLLAFHHQFLILHLHLSYLLLMLPHIIPLLLDNPVELIFFSSPFLPFIIKFNLLLLQFLQLLAMCFTIG